MTPTTTEQSDFGKGTSSRSAQLVHGGVRYHDGQFDDSRLLVNLAQTAAEQGACLLNDGRSTGLVKDAEGFVTGLAFRDQETGASGTLPGLSTSGEGRRNHPPQGSTVRATRNGAEGSTRDVKPN